MLKAVGVQLDQALVGAEDLLHVIAYQIQRVVFRVGVAEYAAQLVGGGALGGDPAGGADHPAKFRRAHQLPVLGAGGGADAFVDQRAAQVVHPGGEQ